MTTRASFAYFWASGVEDRGGICGIEHDERRQVPTPPLQLHPGVAGESARHPGQDRRQERERPAERNTSSSSHSNGSTWQAQLELLLKIRPGMTTYQIQQLLGVADDVNDDTDENDPSGALADRGETLTLLTWRGETNRDLIMIGFINDRLKDTSYIKVH